MNSRITERRGGGAIVEILEEQAQTESGQGKGHITKLRIEKRTITWRGKMYS